jgi:hypothetical protein
MRTLLSCVIGLALVTVFANRASAELSVLYSEVNPTNGHVYYLLGASNWTDAEAKAVELGGHLATIRNSDENDFVWHMGDHAPQTTSFSLWHGFNDIEQEGTWVWTSGETSSWIHWSSPQPENNYPDEDYGGMFYNWGAQGYWHDIIGDNRFGDVVYGVVESVPEPGILTLLGMTGFGMLIFVRRWRM